MRRICKIVIFIMILILIMNIGNVANATQYVAEGSHEWAFHDSAHVAKQLSEYGYTGNCNIVKEENESNYREIKWDMNATIKITAANYGLFKYSLSINGKSISTGSSSSSMERTTAEIHAKNALKQMGFDYKGRLSVGTNNIQYTEVAEIKISKWNDDGKKFKYSYGVYGIDKDNNVDVSENKADGGVKFDEKNAVDMNGAVRYVKPGTHYYSYSKVYSSMQPVERLTGKESVKVLKKDETSGYSKVQLNNGTECYIKNENLLLNPATNKEIEAEEQKQKEEAETINQQISGGSGTNVDIETFDSSGVKVGDKPSTPIEDPTTETGADVYNPYNSSSALTESNSSELINIGKTVIGIVNVIGTIVAVLILIMLGIKYMMGSLEEKAEYKETMIPYVIGAIFVFSSTTIANLIYNFAISFNN